MPNSDIFKRDFIGHVKDNNCSLTSLIKGASDRAEWLLPSSVPNLKLYVVFIFEKHIEVSKLYSDSNVMILKELVLRYPV